MSDDPIHKRPIPTFDQWLREIGHDERADGFEPVVDLIQRALANGPPPHLTDDEAAFYRLWIGFQIAAIELGNREHKLGRSPSQTLGSMPRAMGCAAVYAFVSIMEDGAPLRPLARALTEEFRFGAKVTADDIMEKEAKG